MHQQFSTYGEGHFSGFPRYVHHSYLDDILIYSKTQEQHDIHVHQDLQQLQEYGVYANLEKCSFDQCQVEFLG